MKKLYALLFTVVILTPTISFGQNDPNAKKVLDGLSDKIKSSKGISVLFSLKSITNKGKTNGVKTGTLSVKNSKYYLRWIKYSYPKKYSNVFVVIISNFFVGFSWEKIK